MKSLQFKSLILMGAMLAATMGTISCSGGDDDDPTPTLSVSTSSINVDAGGGSESFQVMSNTSWSISGGTNWCKISPQQGEGNATVYIEINECSSTESRSCTLHVRSTDGSLTQDVSVQQSGAAVSLSVDKSSISFTSAQGEKETLSITANMSWTISGVPDWLNASTTSGNGNSSITLTTKSANNTATARTSTLTVTSSSETKQVTVTQEAGLSACAVRPTNIVTLGTELACDWSYSSSTKYYYCGLWKKTGIERMSDSEIITALEEDDRCTPNDDYVTSWSGLSENTSYVLCTLAYDNENNRGELIKQTITTKQSQGLEATASIDYVYRSDDNKMKWAVTPSGKCALYHMVSGVDVSSNAISCQGVVYAWLINNYINNNKYGLFSGYTIDLNIVREGAYQKSISAPLYEETNVFVATWGKFSDVDGGNYSAEITYAQGYLPTISSSAKKTMSPCASIKTNGNGIKRTVVDLKNFKNIRIR